MKIIWVDFTECSRVE